MDAQFIQAVVIASKKGLRARGGDAFCNRMQ
ncbi:MAG: hypothetical protein ACI95S_001993, partial [Dinoroseobacter sp.]